MCDKKDLIKNIIVYRFMVWSSLQWHFVKIYFISLLFLLFQTLRAACRFEWHEWNRASFDKDFHFCVFVYFFWMKCLEGIRWSSTKLIFFCCTWHTYYGKVCKLANKRNMSWQQKWDLISYETAKFNYVFLLPATLIQFHEKFLLSTTASYMNE